MPGKKEEGLAALIGEKGARAGQSAWDTLSGKVNKPKTGKGITVANKPMGGGNSGVSNIDKYGNLIKTPKPANPSSRNKKAIRKAKKGKSRGN